MQDLRLISVIIAPAVGVGSSHSAGSCVLLPLRNVILLLSDDHRYDFMGFMERAPAWLETPALDRDR